MQATQIHLSAVNGAVHQDEQRRILYIDEDGARKAIFFKPEHEVAFSKPGDYKVTGTARDEFDEQGRTVRPAILTITADGWDKTTNCDITFPEPLED